MDITVFTPLGEQISFSLPDSPMELADFEIAKGTLSEVALKDPLRK